MLGAEETFSGLRSEWKVERWGWQVMRIFLRSLVWWQQGLTIVVESKGPRKKEWEASSPNCN